MSEAKPKQGPSIRVYLSQDEKDEILAEAQRGGQSGSAYLRQQGLYAARSIAKRIPPGTAVAVPAPYYPQPRTGPVPYIAGEPNGPYVRADSLESGSSQIDNASNSTVNYNDGINDVRNDVG